MTGKDLLTLHTSAVRQADVLGRGLIVLELLDVSELKVVIVECT